MKAQQYVDYLYSPDGEYVRDEPTDAKLIFCSNWDAGHMGQSFSPTRHFRFDDGSVVEIGYSGAWVKA